MKLRFCIPLFFLFLALTVSCSCGKDVRSFEAMNTFMVIKSYGRKAAKANLLAQKRICELEDFISVTKAESDVCRVNESLGNEIVLHDETFFVLDFALKTADESSGVFNPLLYPVIREWGFTTGEYRVPAKPEIERLMGFTDYRKVKLNPEKKSVALEKNMMIDLGAVGKGYAGDCALQVLRQNGIKSAVLDLGGNVQVLGKKTDGSLWKIGVKSPWGEGTAAGLEAEDMAVISSGGYERFFEKDGKRYIHIFDGRTGFPAENELAAVTVVCKTGLLGDSLSTTLFVMGLEEACAFWRNRRDFDMILLTNDRRIFYTEPLSERISLLYPFEAVSVVE